MTDKSRLERVAVANEFLTIVSRHGRRFFEHDGRVSFFSLDERNRVWFIDSYSGKWIYTHRRVWGRGFTNGGTLYNLCRDLQSYIMGRSDLPLNHLGPWRKELCDGDLWGYGDEMQAVRDECAGLVATDEGPR